MTTYPEPQQITLGFDRERTMRDANTRGPEAANFFEMEGRVFWVYF